MDRFFRVLGLVLLITAPAVAQEADSDAASSGGDAAADMARKLQDPLANISALMTDNDILFKTGQDETSYSFQLQPVQAFPFEKLNFIARAVVPIMGLAPEAQRPGLGPPLPPGGDYTWGLGDIATQFFFSPKSDSDVKWGLGPTISWQTRTNSKLAGPGWGAGPIAVLVGGAGNVSVAILGGHLWDFDNSFSLSFTQPMVFYNFPNAPGWTLGYNNTISYDWKAPSGNAWTVPIGAMAGKTTDLGGGWGLDLSLGAYWNAVRPEGAAAWSLKYGITLLAP